MNTIEAIRNEIKRLEEIHERNLDKPMERGRIGYAHGVVACCDRILSFIDSLPEEKPSEDLKEVAEEWAENEAYGKPDAEFEMAYKGFIAGAQWQAEQNDKDLSEKIAAAYQLGLANKEEQMMKEAVEGTVHNFSSNKPHPTVLVDAKGFNQGDKVRVIIVKEDER